MILEWGFFLIYWYWIFSVFYTIICNWIFLHGRIYTWPLNCNFLLSFNRIIPDLSGGGKLDWCIFNKHVVYHSLKRNFTLFNFWVTCVTNILLTIKWSLNAKIVLIGVFSTKEVFNWFLIQHSIAYTAYIIRTFSDFLFEFFNADINSWDCLTLMLLSNFVFDFIF